MPITDLNTAPTINAFYTGLVEAVKYLAVWKDGKRYVGAMREPLESVLSQIETARLKSLATMQIDCVRPW